MNVTDFLGMALKGATMKAEVWSSRCGVHDVRVKLGDLELSFEIDGYDLEWPDRSWRKEEPDYDPDMYDHLHRDGIEVVLR